MILWHGTTLRRAEQILAQGPDPLFREPGRAASDEGFSTNLKDGPLLFGHPHDYARGKSRAFPEEGGPAILEMDIPDEIIQRAVTEWFPLHQGLVQFNAGSGLEELLAAWSEIANSAVIRSLS